MKIKIWPLLLASVLVLCGTGCRKSAPSVNASENYAAPESATRPDAETPEPDSGVGTVAEYDGLRAEILDAEFLDSYVEFDGAEPVRAIRVMFSFENSTAEPIYYFQAFSTMAFQNGIELEMRGINDASEITQNTITAIKDGATLECAEVFVLRSDSPVKVNLYTSTADAVLLASETFSP